MNFGVVIVENRCSYEELYWFVQKQKEFLPKNTEYLIFNNENISTLQDYNSLLTSKKFWAQIPFDMVLILQMDAKLLRTGIEEFLMYDYCGAPWTFQQHGGNGGLSLRNVQKMIDVIEEFPYQGASVHGYEDVYFSNHIDKVGGKLAPREVNAKFSCEAIFSLGTFGYHAIDKYLTKEECNQIKTQYK